MNNAMAGIMIAKRTQDGDDVGDNVCDDVGDDVSLFGFIFGRSKNTGCKENLRQLNQQF